MEDYPVGAILRRRLDGFLGLGGWHWGIYAGNGQVVHFSGVAKKERGALVRLESLRKFADGHSVYLQHRPRDPDHGRCVAAMAVELQRFNENGFNGAYRFLTKNCQDFCKHCYENA